jgi:hypothetical protein
MVHPQPPYVYGVHSIPATGGGLAGSHIIDLEPDPPVQVAWEQASENGDIEVSCVDEPAVIEGDKWHDADGDGVKDPAEPLLEGWTITLVAADGTTYTATTDANGHYQFPDLPPGTYTVSEEVRPGWLQVFPQASHTIIVGAGQTASHLDFGNMPVESSAICVDKFYDYDADGAWDTQAGNEYGLEGWTIVISGSGGQLLTGQTDESGRVCFDGVPPGDWTVMEMAQPGWTQTAPAGGTHIVTVGNEATGYTVAFGNRVCDICPEPDLMEVLNTGYDPDTEGVVAPGGVDPNWTVTPGGSGSTAPADVVDNTKNGSQVWAPAFPGSQWITGVSSAGHPSTPPDAPTTYTYERCWCMREGFEQPVLDLTIRADDHVQVFLNGSATPICGSSTTLATVACQTEDPDLFVAGTNCLQVVVTDTLRMVTGLNLVGSISAANGFCCNGVQGVKWHDVNGNGVRDGGEPTLPGWTIVATDSSGNAYTTMTGPDGSYELRNLPADVLDLTEVQKLGWGRTFPLSGVHKLAVAGWHLVQDVDFGNRRRLKGIFLPWTTRP